MHARRPSTLFAALILVIVPPTGAAEVAEPAATPPPPVRLARFSPHFLCFCTPYCPKPAPPAPCWCIDCTCDRYCPKPLPPCPGGCTPKCCDDYCEKPFPTCLPRPLCGPLGVRREPTLCPLWQP